MFGLDPTATEYLLSLAAARPARPAARRPRQETVPAAIRQLIAVVNLPAFVESRMFDVLAANPRATALSPSMRAGENRLRSMFLDPAERDLYPDWRKAIGGMIASFRASIGPDPDDPRIAQLVGELSLASEPFRKLWARHDVRNLAGGAVTMNHPAGRPARALAGEAPDRRLRRPAAGDVPRRAGLRQRPGAGAARSGGDRPNRDGPLPDRPPSAHRGAKHDKGHNKDHDADEQQEQQPVDHRAQDPQRDGRQDKQQKKHHWIPLAR